MLLWLHSLPFLFYVCQRSALCSCGYILHHYCFMFVRGVLYVLVVTFSTITVLCWSEECFMFLWLHSRPLLFYVGQRSGLCYCGYILYHFCFMFVRGVLYVLVVTFSTITVLCLSEECFMFLWLHSLPLLFYVGQRSASCSCGYILDHYCFMFVRGVLHVIVVTFSTITVLCLSEECFMFLWLHSPPLLFYVCQRSDSCYCGYILYHYCFMYVSEVVHVVISYMYILDKYCLL